MYLAAKSLVRGLNNSIVNMKFKLHVFKNIYINLTKV